MIKRDVETFSIYHVSDTKMWDLIWQGFQRHVNVRSPVYYTYFKWKKKCFILFNVKIIRKENTPTFIFLNVHYVRGICLSIKCNVH